MIPKRISTDGWEFIACAAVVFLCLVLEELWRFHRQARSQTWPLKFGQVSKAAVHQDKHECTLTLWYSYPASDEPYPIPAEFQKKFYSLEEAQRWADALCDKAIPVRVNPANSWKSQLLDSDLELIVIAATPR